MTSLESLINRQRNAGRTYCRIKMRNHLNADALYSRIREDFDKIPDHRAANVQISISDALMSGLAMFCLKDPSLLAFERRRNDEPDSLHEVFSIKNIPCDSQMRTILDALSVREIRRPFKSVFAQLQRGKALEKMTFLQGHYLLAIDGTGVYTSEKISSPYCQSKRKRNGKTEYYQQMVAGALVHPDQAGAHHCFRFLNNVPLNKSSEGSLPVNFPEYWQSDDTGNIQWRFAWVTDINLSNENVYDIMRAGRARWRIENETFNTLKNQGYNLGHNYGLGKKHLSAVFAHLILLAFLIDQVQQMCCPLFQAARAKCPANKYLWEDIRNFFRLFWRICG